MSEQPNLDQAPEPSAGSERRARGITGRAVILALVLIPLNCWWVLQMERFRFSSWPTGYGIFFNAVFTLMVLYLANLLVLRLCPRLALAQSELLFIFSLVSVASAMVSVDFIQVLMPNITYSFHVASPENNWNDLINPLMPRWLTVSEPRVYEGFYHGGVNPYQGWIIRAWLPALASWTGFIMALMLVLVCSTVLIRRQWLEHEHLSCPLVRIPVQISSPQGRLFRRGLFWLGFALAFGIDAWNGVAFHFPALPSIPIRFYNIATALISRPWNVVGRVYRAFYPWIIGVGYLMPTDFVFSCWFFRIFWRLELVVFAALGADVNPEGLGSFPHINMQNFGAYLLFAVAAMWVGRKHLETIWRIIVGLPAKIVDTNEPMSFRYAGLGIVAGIGALLWFSITFGMSLWVAAVVFFMYFVLALSITRMRAQFGTPLHDLHHTGPQHILIGMLGTRPFTDADIVGLGVYRWFNRAYRAHPMPHLLEAMRMQDQTGKGSQGIVPWLLMAAFLGTVTGMWIMVATNYQLGAEAKGSGGLDPMFAEVGNWLSTPNPANLGKGLAVAIGFALAAGMQWMRFHHVGWPFHPLGFVISGYHEMTIIVMPLFLAWLCKVLIVRYGGYKLYQRAMALFVGLVLGEFVAGSIINLTGVVLQFPPWHAYNPFR